MKKVCMLVNNTLTDDSRVFKEAETLGSSGYKITILGLRNKNLPLIEIKPFYSIKRAFDYDIDFSPNPFHQLKSLFQLWKSAVKENADIYHAHDLDTLVVGFLCSKKNKSKLIYDSHELWWDRNISGNYKLVKSVIQYLWRMEEYLLIKKADRVITVNESIANFLKKKYDLPSVEYLLNCLHSTNIEKAKNHVRNSEKKIVLYLGKISEGRGLENLVQSGKYLNPNIEIIIYGRGKLKTKLLLLVKKQKICNVHFHEPVAPKEIIKTAKIADVGIAPIQNTSLTHYFASPNKVYEYLSAGLPILVSDLPELKKIVQEYAVGLTINPEDPKSIAQTINQAVSNPILLERMRQEAKKAVVKKYNWEKQAEKLISLYSSMIQK